ncbi:MAG TPA: T9SS type A sorting domain-containing protein, partial [Paludibacter sp.]
SFTKGPVAQTVTPTAVSPISAITLTWTPVNTAIDNVEFSKLYNVYPNPAVSSVYVTGSDIKEVQICSLAGKILLSSKEQKVNISVLPKGFYLAVIYAKDGMVVKKIEKL